MPLTPPTVRPDEFSFVLLADRTGMARPGVFERAVEVTNLLRPAFALQIGDTIEGYAEDPDDVRAQWDEVDAITARLAGPYRRTPANHDVSAAGARRVWLERGGPLHGHFRFGDVLFLLVDTQDPPPPLIDCLRPIDEDDLAAMPAELVSFVEGLEGRPDDEVIAAIERRMLDDPGVVVELMRAIESGTQPARIGDVQTEELLAAVAAHDDVRWTMVCMHMPAWQGAGHPSVDRLRRALGQRPYTMFAGHCHAYEHTRIDGRDHIRMGTSGGLRLVEGGGGVEDHVMLVTMTADGPRIANVGLDAVSGADGRPAAPGRPRSAAGAPD
jgi:hypothetical protein